MTTQVSGKELSGIRALMFPVYSSEMKKFMPLAAIMYLILFNYTVLRNLKDALIVGSAGAGVITFLKLYCVMPSAVLFVIIYTKLINKFESEKTFYIIGTFFISFFTLFAFINQFFGDAVHPSAETLSALSAAYPSLKGFISIYGYWSYSLFYVMSELWGSAMLSLAFWQFANQITRMTEAKRFYGLFVVIGNIATALSGQFIVFCTSAAKKFFSSQDEWAASLSIAMFVVVLSGIVMMAIYRWMHLVVLTDPLYYDGPKKGAVVKKKKPGIIDSAKIIFKSPQLGYIVLLIVAYGVSINLLEVQWKTQIGIYLHHNKAAIGKFMGQYSFWTGVMSIVFALFFGSNILRRFSWLVAALFTPVIILVTGIVFFIFVIGTDKLVDFLPAIRDINIAYAASILGAFVVVMSKVVKYCLFDPTKEMAYIPMDEELRTKGKASVDVIGGRLGKSCGAATQSTLFMMLGTLNAVDISGPAFAVFIAVCVAWVYSAYGLSKYIK